MNRDDVIEQMVEKYREDLEEKDDEDLLGSTLEEMRQEAIENLLERYQEELEGKSDKELEGIGT